MDLEAARSKQREAQKKAQTQPSGVARIGDRDTNSGSWYVRFPDGGVAANGLKTYTAASKPGDIVVMFPRADGSIALDSEKGSPTVFPPIFNKPVEEEKKAKVWILYFFEGKLWVGGHQAQPEEVGRVYLGGPQPIPESAGGPGLLGYRNTSNLHIWGDADGWIATYQTFPVNYTSSHAVTFHAVTATTHKKYSTAFALDENGSASGNNAVLDNNDRSFPLGGGFVSYRSIRQISSVVPEVIFDNTVSQTYSSIQQVTIGYMENAVPTVNQFNSNSSFSSIVFSYVTTNRILSYSGTIPIPHLDRGTGLSIPYSGLFSCGESSDSGKGPYFNSAQNIVYPVLTVQIVHNYPILCDRSSSYYIQESVIINGYSIQKVYELRSTNSQTFIDRNYTEPRFFGIRWDIRESALVIGEWPESSATDRYKYVTYSDPAYYYPAYSLDSTFHGEGVMPIGHFNRAPDGVTPIDEYRFYPQFVTFSGGQVVTISATEINKAKVGGAYLQRQSVDVDGKRTSLAPIFCHAIPASAIVHHWSTTAL